MIGCLWTRVCKQPIIALYFEFETVLKFLKLRARCSESGNAQKRLYTGAVLLESILLPYTILGV